MHSYHRYYYYLDRQDKLELRTMLLQKKPVNNISKKYGLSSHFIKVLHQDLMKDTIPVYFNSKDCAYYEDEMSYGKLNLKYK